MENFPTTIPQDGKYLSVYIAATMFFNIKEKRLHEQGGGLSIHTASSFDELDPALQAQSIWNEFGYNFKVCLIGFSHFIKIVPYTDEQDQVDLFEKMDSTVKNMIAYLWFIKDNSAYVTLTGTYSGKERSLMSSPLDAYSKADGHYTSTEFTLDEMTEARLIYAKLKSINDNYEKENKLIRPKTSRFNAPFPINNSTIYQLEREYNTNNRIERAVSFMFDARNTAVLPEKISFYVMILECLFTPKDKTEIQYKLCDRVSVYISQEMGERIAIYELVKNGYNVRSRYVHGDELDKPFNTNAQLKELSVKLDGLIRTILKKVILEDSDLFLKKSDDLIKYFFNQKFSIPGPAIDLPTDDQPPA